ncbi:hypothetical protein J4N45_10485 [Vibrio sp. SCSIO 43140]|uniref:hypothetical protein n=1 Tax=Vibrio sp. SCSIO 43140 TaxID=2819100 RepID=UPI002075F04F|nr:hypothetical protein [Vibrio sp. SCSIO 43140]USD58957.1 hypothetical protein J4N45_10485 [Vibrio sp. SCSIO 43140]
MSHPSKEYNELWAWFKDAFRLNQLIESLPDESISDFDSREVMAEGVSSFKKGTEKHLAVIKAKLLVFNEHKTPNGSEGFSVWLNFVDVPVVHLPQLIEVWSQHIPSGNAREYVMHIDFNSGSHASVFIEKFHLVDKDDPKLEVLMVLKNVLDEMLAGDYNLLHF